MNTARTFARCVTFTGLLLMAGYVPAFAGQQPDPKVAAATGCSIPAFNSARAEFERLQTLRQFSPEAVSDEALRAASVDYVAQSEACYQAFYADATLKIDDGGVRLDPDKMVAVADPFLTFGTKWGAGSPFTGGQDKPGPSIAGGTVTYSFIPNGVSHAAESSDANVAITSLPGYQACFTTRIVSAFAAWTAIANIQFVQVTDNGVASNAAGAAGDIRIGAHTFDGAYNVLAHGYYPPPNGATIAGDVHFDRQEPWACAPVSSNAVLDIGIVALHEVGHALGLNHQTALPTGKLAVMNPIYNNALLVLQPDDLNGIWAIYGPAFPGGGPTSSDDLVADFGPAYGLWILQDGNTSAWAQIHAVSPKSVVTGDLDGNGIDEIVADFAASGIWVRLNNGGWFQLYTGSANRIATGDLDGNGKDEVIIDLPGAGIWVWQNNNSWFQLHSSNSSNIVTGDLDGNGRKEAIIDFPGLGIWVWRNNTSWFQLHTLNATSLAVGDFDANGRADLIVHFPGAGIWNYANNSVWSQVHPLNPTRLTIGDVDGNGKSDLVVDFGGNVGIWLLLNSASWTRIHTLASTDLITGDVNGNGKAEIIVSFGSAGLWAYADNTTWVQLHTVSPEAMAVGDFNAP